MNYVEKYGYCLSNSSLSPIHSLSLNNRRHCLAALSNLAKYQGNYEDFRKMIRDHGLKWESTKTEDLLIARLSRAETENNVLEWIKEAKARLPRFQVFMDFVAISGLRFVEAFSSYNLIIDLARQDKLKEYYNQEKKILEHYRFKTIFIRGNKKAFVTFIPHWIVEAIAKQEKVTQSSIDDALEDVGLKMRFSDIREYYATMMTQYLTQPEIDFLQGRISGSVFMRNYFNPALITDLKERTFKAITEIQQKI